MRVLQTASGPSFGFVVDLVMALTLTCVICALLLEVYLWAGRMNLGDLTLAGGLLLFLSFYLRRRVRILQRSHQAAERSL